MIKRIKLYGFILCALTLLSCASTNTGSSKDSGSTKNQNTETEANMETKKDFITNGYAGDCPSEYADFRLDGVNYGKIDHVIYHSNTCKMDRPFSILLPASYDGVKKYPVVYFQHGIFGDENCIIRDENNRIRQITANLAADGKAPEMIFVFGHMFATDDPNQKPGFNAKNVLPYDNFINELVNDLMPYVESHYSVLTGRENTAVCGFSMGGRESLYIGLQRPDLFAYIGAIAPAPGLVPSRDGFMAHEGQFASEEEMKFPEEMPLPELLMVCCGTIDGTVGQFPKSYHKIFEKNGVEHVWFEVLSANHDSMAIRSGLYYFVSHIFKK